MTVRLPPVAVAEIALGSSPSPEIAIAAPLPSTAIDEPERAPGTSQAGPVVPPATAASAVDRAGLRAPSRVAALEAVLLARLRGACSAGSGSSGADHGAPGRLRSTGRPQVGAEARAPESGRAALAARVVRAAPGTLRGAEQDVELVDARLEADQLRAALEQQILAEAVAPVHLEREPAEVAQLLLAQPQERAALAAELARGRRVPAGVAAGGAARPAPAAPCAGSGRRGTAASVLTAARRASPQAGLELEDDEALLGQLAHRVGRPLARVAGVLDAAVGHLVGAEGRRLVDRDAAELEPLRRRERGRTSLVKIPAWRP